MDLRIAIVTQARMTSTRLPGKIMREIMGKSLLEYQLERLGRVSLANSIVVATTTNEADNPVVHLCNRLGVSWYRGSEHDVLSRFYQTAETYDVDILVRVTSDCPLIDPAVIDMVIDYFLLHQSEYDYVSNTLKRTFPRGMDVEVFSRKVLVEAYEESSNLMEREHVTPFFYLRPERFRLGNVSCQKDYSCHRWTVDTLEDFVLIEKIISELYPVHQEFSLEDILKTMNKHDSWFKINQHIEQKSL